MTAGGNVSHPRGTNSALREVAGLFLKLGVIAFGGPAAHIAMMRDEVVRRRRWLSDQEFLDMLGATNLIPGPNSTEMAIHLGYARAGARGLLAAGIAFIVPAMLIVLVFAWMYVRFGATPTAQWLLYGVKPVIIAIILQALWGLGRTAVRTVPLGGVGLVVLALYLWGVNEIALLLGAGVTVMLAMNTRALRAAKLLPALLVGAVADLAYAGAAEAARAPFSPERLFLIFLKIGSVLYGSGYVLLAFLRGDFVLRLGWLTDRQLLDAIAIGQFTPGPVFTTATFIGYILGGVPAALLATAGIFLPSFVFVAASHPFIAQMRRSPWAGALLDGVNVASLALMAGVAGQLARTAVVDPITLAVALAAAILLFRFRVNSAWLVLGGAGIGWVSHVL
jgi:chromate transporter